MKQTILNRLFATHLSDFPKETPAGNAYPIADLVHPALRQSGILSS